MLGIGHRLGDERPELRGVVLVGEVGEFVDDDVLDEGGSQHHGAPVEAECAVGGAASPALALITDEDAGRLAFTPLPSTVI